MNDRRKRSRRTGPPGASPRWIAVRPVPGEEAFELVYPRCVERRADDLAEVRTMLAAGEIDVAVDELRWLLQGCRELLEAHKLLGEIALSEGDLALARGHFGRAYELAMEAIPKGGLRGPLPHARPANRPFFESGRRLVQCLRELNERKLAAEVVGELLALDPGDPLRLRELLR